MQVRPDGTADFVSFRPRAQYAVRWIMRGADQDALGLVPATAEPMVILQPGKGPPGPCRAGRMFPALRFGAMTADWLEPNG
jgi:hypothetical protein